jgi:hypothetical protein
LPGLNNGGKRPIVTKRASTYQGKAHKVKDDRMKTRDYTIFKSINGNRKVNNNHVLRLGRAMERKNLLPYYPVLCNEGMEVVDGQHRLAAAIRLGYEVSYEKIRGLRIEDVMEINTNSKGWSINDFINSWIVLDKPDYRTLRDFMERNKMNATLAGVLLRGYGNARGGGDISRLIKGGMFKVASEPLANAVATQLTGLKQYAEFNVMSDRELAATLLRLTYNDAFDFNRLISKLRLHGLKLGKRANEKYYILHIEELYNFHNSVMVELYESTYTTARVSKG